MLPMVRFLSFVGIDYLSGVYGPFPVWGGLSRVFSAKII